MGLELHLTKSSISTEGVMVITDSTGTYDATDNTTGYGAPNPARADLALLLRAYNKRYDGLESLTDTALVIATYDPEVVTQWSLTLNKDGWQLATVYGLKLYSTATSFELNELTYDSATDEIRKILTKSGAGPYTYTYEVVTEAALEVDGNVIPYTYALNTYSLLDLCECHYKVNKKYTEALVDEDEETAETHWTTYTKLDALMKAIKYDFAQESYSEGQKIVEKCENICTCFTDDCNC